jgi:hypothetical protein
MGERGAKPLGKRIVGVVGQAHRVPRGRHVDLVRTHTLHEEPAGLATLQLLWRQAVARSQLRVRAEREVTAADEKDVDLEGELLEPKVAERPEGLRRLACHILEPVPSHVPDGRPGAPHETGDPARQLEPRDPRGEHVAVVLEVERAPQADAHHARQSLPAELTPP